MEEYEFEIGERVRVIDPYKSDKRLIEIIGFNDEMEGMIGKEYIISDVRGSINIPGVNVYSVEGEEWVFAGQWLEPVNKREQNIHEDDFDGVFD